LSDPGQLLVVVVDDARREDLSRHLSEAGHALESASDAEAALEAIERMAPDVAVFERACCGERFEHLQAARARMPRGSLLVLSGSGSVHDVVDAIQNGADHCLAAEASAEAIAVMLERALEKSVLARREAEVRTRVQERLDRGNFERIVGAHPLMQRMLNKVFQAAQSRATVLILGETGTGKELIAAAIHNNSKRASGPFVRLNCAALAESVLESELFGHEKGAFTGAAARRKGRFEQAHGGSLFLDEVSEMPSSVQVKLLRFLQEREFERVGGEETVQVDVRVIAASNRDLKALVDDGGFREDLYYRLNVVRLDVPPLRARPSDIALLADHFMAHFAAENDKEIHGVAPGARDALLAHPWPGNVRELQNVMEQAVVLCEGSEIVVDDLPISSSGDSPEPVRLMIPGVTLAELERYAIMKTLESVGGSPSRAAEILGVSRRTIQYRLSEWGLTARGMRVRGDDADGPPSEPSSYDGPADDTPTPTPSVPD
jgi:two-component system response regulator HydG